MPCYQQGWAQGVGGKKFALIFFSYPPPPPGVPPEKKAVRRYQEFFFYPPPPGMGHLCPRYGLVQATASVGTVFVWDLI